MKILERSKRESRPTIFVERENIISICRNRKVDRVIVALDERRGRLPLNQLLLCRLKGVRVDDGITFTENLAGRLFVENLHPSSLIFTNGFHKSSIYKKMKIYLDVIVSLLGLFLSIPLCLLIALAIKMDSEGPVLYKQERVGEGGRTFYLWKFRSMRIDAEENGPVWALSNDERVTRIGRVIRMFRLDEIPQIVNVLRGQMSFVGPRPERPFFVKQLEKEIPYYQIRHIVKPGITGWAQIKYHYGASKEDALEKLKYELYYIKHMSIFFDLMIVFETVKIVLIGKGAR